MRGGLDDALDKLARRDELRRRAAGESGGGTPPAVTELVEAIAGVVSRNPQMTVTVGVEGAGDPVLLHFAMADGVVQVTADNAVAARATEAGPRHADFEIDVEEPVEEPPPAAPPRASRDDQDRFGPTTDFEYVEPTTAEQPFVTNRHEQAFGYEQPAGYAEQGNTTPHPFAPTPPPQVPTQPYAPAAHHQGYPEPHPYAQAYPAQHAEPQQPGFPEPLPEPIPLQVERPEETEMAARRLAAMLRSDPTLLDGPQ
ncbi:hypothetical protein Aph02nite_93360 [Actinoplanes philippinensis]|uniref:Uncharacterized protein n=1 Tax=Actinoplanes philippinensis TaxID=35752 RepID=A0A1I2N5L6_9ACTN|nr:hypothetical protein [Actinoplanes philippinensis]GIE83386.1 hypothetical protein Aph02nite_93360 [Actinoplanes philippinensis]SFF99062.1 hypothetical protein SAMN05421541_13922 [Actinoplanes philippinensis]